MIAIKLKSEYQSINVYKSRVVQNVTLPCFFITLIKLENMPNLKGMLNLKYTFKITYISDNSDDIYSVSESVFSKLKYVGDNEIKSSSMNIEILENEFNLFLCFNLFFKEEKEKFHIKSLKGNIVIDGGKRV